METRALGLSGLSIVPLVFGGNVFGWTLDEKASWRMLDQLVDYGLDAIDTADCYSLWVPGNQGGESESIIGRWLKANPGKRDKIKLFTKVGWDLGGGRKGLSAKYIPQAAEASLQRLHTDYIDLYQSHCPDDGTPHAETLGAFDTLIRAGKVRAIGASNVNVHQLQSALRVASAEGLPSYTTLQPEYNLYDRHNYDGPLRDLAIEQSLGVITYFSLASGFLSGKYRSPEDLGKSARGGSIGKYLDAKGQAILQALDEVAGNLKATPAEVALAWLIQRKGVTAPIASATSEAQLMSLVNAVRLKLPEEAVELLTATSAL